MGSLCNVRIKYWSLISFFLNMFLYFIREKIGYSFILYGYNCLMEVLFYNLINKYVLKIYFWLLSESFGVILGIGKVKKKV